MNGIVLAKRSSASRTIVIAVVAVYLLAAQAVHVLAATGPCFAPQATAPDSSHNCSQAQHTSHQGGQSRTGCYCGDSPVCGCELNQGRTAERQDVPVAFAGHLNGHAQSDPGAANSNIAVVPDLMGSNPDPRWVEARAPSETSRFNTTKLLC